MTVFRSGFGRLLFVALWTLALLTAARAAEPVTASRCIALASAAPKVQLVSLNNAAIARDEVDIRFVGHSTFRIESAGGVVIATDYTGYAGTGRSPDVVTMNHAHTSHYTSYPDPAIKHVLRGWGTDGGPAKHSLSVGDVFIRNVTTDIRGWDGIREKDGNSIFIFEVANLCIGHLGHLHHTLGPEYLGLIGQLDIVMVPVDGTYTMSQTAMMDVLELLKARLVLPMHYFGQSTLSRFLNTLSERFVIEIATENSITVSYRTLPDQPLVKVLPGF
jgi:L-ascorbate metabolism protein UlaG (beta-lactamase superfamily)